MVPARCAAGSAATALVTALRALRFEGGAVEARFRRGYYASQLSTDVVFYFILLASEAPPAYLSHHPAQQPRATPCPSCSLQERRHL